MSLRKRLQISALLFIFAIAALFFCNQVSIQLLSAVRASISGEGLWSKAQKNSVQDLYQYLVTGEPKLLADYAESSAVIDQFEAARIELSRSRPDFSRSDELLVRAGISPDDTRPVAYLFHYAGALPFVAEAKNIWERGDRRYDELEAIVGEIRARGAPPSGDERRTYFRKIAAINQELTGLEKEYSAVLARGSRLAVRILWWLNVLTALGFTGAAILICRRAIGYLARSIDAILHGLQRIHRGELGYRLDTAAAGELAHLAGVFNGLLDTRARAGELETEKKRYETLIDALNRTAIVSLTDRDGTIVMANDRFCEITGYSREELVGRNHRIVRSGVHPKEFFAGMWRTIKRGDVWSAEVCNRRKDGTHYWVDSTITPITDVDGNRRYLSIRYDVTGRKQLEQQMLNSSKMASLGEMAAGVAHEINNPLTIILGKLDRVRRMAAGQAAMLAELDHVKQTAQRIETIVKGLRVFSRDASRDPFEVSALQPILDVTLSLCRERIRDSGVELRLGAVPDVSLECLPTQVSQILLNLLGNAYDAVAPLEPRWIELGFAVTESSLRIAVTDSGGGIPAEIAGKIMHPFFTTKEAGKGTGLGLSISLALAQRHRGTLELDASSRNTRFVLELPLRQPAPRPATS